MSKLTRANKKKQFPPNMLYEYTFCSKYQDTFVRMFNTDTKQSSIYKIDANDFTPTLYIPDDKGTYTSHINSKIKLSPLTFNSHKEFKETAKKLVADGVMVHGSISKPHSFIRENFMPTMEHNHDARIWFLDIESRKGVNGYSKPDVASEPICLIQIYDNYTKTFYIMGYKDYTDTYISEFGNIKYMNFGDERNMLENFIRLLEKMNPFGISGWSVLGYDIPYITNRLELLNFDISRLSPVGIVTKESKKHPVLDSYYQHCIWAGRAVLDYQILHTKYTYLKLPDKSLQTVLTAELGEEKGKVHYDFYDLDAMYRGDHTQYDITEENKDSILSQLKVLIDAGQIQYIPQFKQEAFNMFVRYGIRDIDGILELDQKIRYIDTAKNIAYRCGVNVDDVMGTLEQWKNLMYNTTELENNILPVKQQYALEDAIYLGGWTTSKPGKYKEVFSVDFSSLYPNVDRTLNAGMDTYIKPDTYNEQDLEFLNTYFNFYIQENAEQMKVNDNVYEMKYFCELIKNKDAIHNFLVSRNVTISANGCMYTKEFEAAYSKLLGGIYSERKGEQGIMATATDNIDAINKCMSKIQLV